MLPLKAQARESELRFYMDLCPAAGEDVEEQGFQEELKKLFHDLRALRVDVSPGYYVTDNVYGSGGLSGEFFLPALRMISAPVVTVLDAFFRSHPGRIARLKIAALDAPAHNAEDVKELLASAEKYLKVKSEDKTEP